MPVASGLVPFPNFVLHLSAAAASLEVLIFVIRGVLV